MPGSLIDIARRFNFVRETLGPNDGYWVSFMQRFCGGHEGDSWCADFVSLVLNIAYKGQSPLRKTGSTIIMLDEARAKGFVVAVPEPGCLYFFTNDSGTPHHVGIVTVVNNLRAVIGIAGNTSADGTSSNGTGVFEHSIPVGPKTIFVKVK